MKFAVLKKDNLKRNIIIGVFAVLIISAVVLNFTRAKYRSTASVPIVDSEINYSRPDLEIIALYIDGVAAEELDSNTNYTLDTTNSTCTYKDGSSIDNLTLSYDSETKTFTIAPYTTRGTKCYLYFEEELLPAVDVIEGLYASNTSTMAYDDTGNLRYIGANPNNYVSFNGELWRIIGIFSEDTHGISNTKLIKLIRNESIGNYSWDNTSSYGSNDWSDSALQIVLNSGAYYNRTSGTCPDGSYESTTTCDFSSTGITDEAKSMIETVTWKLGGSSTYDDVTASMFYERERGTTVYSGMPTEWSGKVGLMYPSDYGYATSGGATTDRQTCLATEMYSWNSSSYSDCKTNNWLYNISWQWTITPRSSNSVTVCNVHTNGNLSHGFASDGDATRPSIYLKANITISGGDGSYELPYQLSLNN